MSQQGAGGPRFGGRRPASAPSPPTHRGLVNRTPLPVALEGARSVAMDLGVEVAAEYADPGAEERALRQGAGMVDRSARGAVLVSGPDAVSFLHSLLSQDVAGL